MFANVESEDSGCPKVCLRLPLHPFIPHQIFEITTFAAWR